MTAEQQEYGKGWIRCVRCGVCDAEKQRTYFASKEVWVCSSRVRCDKFREELGPLAPSVEHLKKLGVA